MNDGESYLPESSGEVGLVQPRDFHYGEAFLCESGETLPEINVRYETYGRLNQVRDNAVLVCHALSGDHHCAGIHSVQDRKSGWWNNFIGPGKTIDTRRFFVICSNCLGGCQGTTGPSSLNPQTGRSYGLDFPLVTIRDMVRVQRLLLDHLGVSSLHACVGGSMGGMQVLQWGIEYPGFVRRLLPMATTARQNSQAIAFNEVGRQAILQDPAWEEGNYSREGGPRVGLAIARMMAHITYLSDKSLDRKFGRKRRQLQRRENRFAIEFEVESYLRYQGTTFINRFDANTYLYFTRALDFFDLAETYGSLEKAFSPVESRILVVGFTSDWLFPPEQNKAIVHAFLRAGKPASYAEIALDQGHDSFLIESPDLYQLVQGYLESD